MKHLLKLSRNSIAVIIFVLLIFSLNIHCSSGGSGNASDPGESSTQKIEQTLRELATAAESPSSNDPASREEQLDTALRNAFADIIYYTNSEMTGDDNDVTLTRTMIFDLSRILLKFYDYPNTYTTLRSLNFLDLNSDGAADQTLEEFAAYIKNFAAIFANVMDMNELVDYRTEIQSNLEGLVNVSTQIDNVNNIITVLDSIVAYSNNNLANLFSNTIYNVLPNLEDSVYRLKMVLSGDLNAQTIPSILDDMVSNYGVLAEKLREETGLSYSYMNLPLLSGDTYLVWTNATLAKYIDGYETDSVDGEDVLNIDPDMQGGLIGILQYFRSLLGGTDSSGVAQLSNLAVSAGTLTPIFSKDTLSYTVLVPKNIASITVTPSAPGNDMNITVNGTAVKSGNSSQPIELHSDTYTNIVIIVDDEESQTARMYTVSARRIGDSTATLDDLALSTGSLVPSFRSDRLDYSVEVDNDITAMSVTPAAASGFSTISVNGSSVASGSASAPISLNVGINLISVIVTAEDETTCTYTITVKRLGSHNADLSAITLSQGTLTPSFSSGTLSYTAEVENAITSLTVSSTTAESYAMISVNDVASTSGTAVTVSNLLVGANTIRIVVTAQDGTTTKIYTVTVTRKASSNANLSGLSISQGTLSPTFAAGTTAYSATVANTITSMTVTPRVEDGTATVKVNGTTVVSGTASGAISLALDNNTITVTVTAQDGVTVRTYTLTVTRLRSNNAYLSGLYLDNVDLSPSFSSTTYYYTDWVWLFCGGTNVRPTAAHSGATIRVNGTIVASGSSRWVDFGYGNNYIYIVVTAEDGVTTRTYTVKVSRF